ncbi:MAG TPA: OFA family MFS transporter [Steroidobacteraceae bacterium]|jgi:MFS family permease|nr:OFA family MFS transporter [Steroidobacteraceae bacterium]
MSNSFLSRERTIAGPGFNRWVVPPAALAIHLCIGMAYGFSVFWLPLSKAIGITKPVSCPATIGFFETLTQTSCDWKVKSLTWTFTIFIAVLGCAAAAFGGWLERAGPRKAGVVAALCWCGGFVISAGGIAAHQLWLIWLGAGFIGGIGLGIGYISPVSTLIKWFPDRRGMATGMAIMGFGGGAMIGAPLADRLMKLFATPSSVGVWQTFLALAAIYFVYMIGGALAYRVPPESWAPAGWAPKPRTRSDLITDHDVALDVAWRTPQFWLLWGVLCLNVTAGIGILAMASPLLQEVFGGRLIGLATGFDDLTPAQKAQLAAIAAGFTGLLSLFNIGGRIFWASLSDRIGRKSTYMVFFVLGIALYLAVPWTASGAQLALFVGCCCVILSMYGGGFSTIPAYLSDLFGTRMVGAIHGRLLTSWSVAGVIGPLLISYIRDYQIDHGVRGAQIYNVTMYLLAALLVGGLVCNLLVGAVHQRHHMADSAAYGASPGHPGLPEPVASEHQTASAKVIAAWLIVWIPIGWGVWMTLQKAVVLFR